MYLYDNEWQLSTYQQYPPRHNKRNVLILMIRSDDKKKMTFSFGLAF